MGHIIRHRLLIIRHCTEYRQYDQDNHGDQQIFITQAVRHRHGRIFPGPDKIHHGGTGKPHNGAGGPDTDSHRNAGQRRHIVLSGLPERAGKGCGNTGKQIDKQHSHFAGQRFTVNAEHQKGDEIDAQMKRIGMKQDAGYIAPPVAGQ